LSGSGQVFRHPDVYPRFSTRDAEWKQFSGTSFSNGHEPNHYGFTAMYTDQEKSRQPVDGGKQGWSDGTEIDATIASELQSRWPENQMGDRSIQGRGKVGEQRALGNPAEIPGMKSPSRHAGQWKGD